MFVYTKEHSCSRRSHVSRAQSLRPTMLGAPFNTSATTALKFRISAKQSGPVNRIRPVWSCATVSPTFPCFGMQMPMLAKRQFKRRAWSLVCNIHKILFLKSNFVSDNTKCRQHMTTCVGSTSSKGRRCQPVLACVFSKSTMLVGAWSLSMSVCVVNVCLQPGHVKGNLSPGASKWAMR